MACPTWLLWAGAGQKLSFSLFFGVSNQNCLTCAFLHGMGEGADILEWQDHPWEGCVMPFAGLVCDTAAAMS